MAELKVIHKLSTMSASPDARAIVEGSKVKVELDDDERKLRLSFAPYQALRITTADCFAVTDDIVLTPRTIMEVLDSDWLLTLRTALAQADESASFLDRSHHFLIPACDDVIEVVAWELEIGI